jgi:dihydroflavonol-4-reductase
LPDCVLVTGSTGFVGSALCRTLLAEGFHVRAFHRPSSNLRALNGLAVERIAGDVLQAETLPPAMDGVRWVFHAAAQADYWREQRGVLETSVDGTRNVVQAARAAGVARLILTSSVAALGIPQPGELLDERSTFNLPPQRFPYGYGKHMAELEARRQAGEALDIVIVNPAIILGPGDWNRISGSLVIEAARGLSFIYTEGGVNLIHIQDVVDGHLAAALRGRSGERYILGHENLTNYQVFAGLAEITGARPPWLKLPGWSIGPLAMLIDGLRHVAPLPLDGNQLRLSRQRLWCDTHKASRELGLVPKRSFRQTAEETFNWYRQQGIV